MIRSSASLALLAATAMFTALSASAQTQPAVPPAPASLSALQNNGISHLLKKLDKDGDGAISEAEFLAPLENQFKRLDKNADGVIDSQDVKAFSLRRLRHADANGDGKISLDEFLATAKEIFKKADADKDGKVAKDEIRMLLMAQHKSLLPNAQKTPTTPLAPAPIPPAATGTPPATLTPTAPTAPTKTPPQPSAKTGNNGGAGNVPLPTSPLIPTGPAMPGG